MYDLDDVQEDDVVDELPDFMKPDETKPEEDDTESGVAPGEPDDTPDDHGDDEDR
jgi:hypothetical protein